MSKKSSVDIKENLLIKIDSDLLAILLKDNSSGNNIIWATDNYEHLGNGYASNDFITIESITGINGNIIKPRVEKTKEEQISRAKKKAEVFTPSWICNKQNNLIDNAWLKKSFNNEIKNNWIVNKRRILFLKGKTWKDYVKVQRLEIACGEAPYLVSRYDTVTGSIIPVDERIGLLDRKMRVVSENNDEETDWYFWAKEAYKSVYGFDWQGDNVLLSRENLWYSFIDYYKNKFGKHPSKMYLIEIATIVSWNIWQMDGLKFVIPNSCHVEKRMDHTLFDKVMYEQECEGCRINNPTKHNGIYSCVMDWDSNKKVKFIDLVENK